MSDADLPLPDLPPTPLGRYRHYKGGEYDVIGVARHSETLEPLVVYRPLCNDNDNDNDNDNVSGWWLRPHAMFFGTLTVEGVPVQRFTRMATA